MKTMVRAAATAIALIAALLPPVLATADGIPPPWPSVHFESLEQHGAAVEVILKGDYGWDIALRAENEEYDKVGIFWCQPVTALEEVPHDGTVPHRRFLAECVPPGEINFMLVDCDGGEGEYEEMEIEVDDVGQDCPFGEEAFDGEVDCSVGAIGRAAGRAAPAVGLFSIGLAALLIARRKR
jgi:hypothetical protein